MSIASGYATLTFAGVRDTHLVDYRLRSKGKVY